MRFSSLVLVSFGLLAGNAAAWTKEDHEIFRVKAEIDETEGPITFYEFINCPSGIACTQDELTKSFKRTSLKMHPDKFKKPTKSNPGTPILPKSTYIPQNLKAASERYARLSLVSNILKGPERARYDHFLRNGFPIWKGTNYYYSRFRPGLGTVLIGLFLVFGGVGHYGMQVVSYRQHRKFMEAYINEARQSAWGSTTPSITLESLTNSAADDKEEELAAPTNRKERRAREKGKTASGNNTPKRTATPTPGATTHVAKRKVTAPNGKTFMVTQTGDVYLVEEDEDGVNQEYLLDLEEIPKPSWGRTAVAKLPGWILGKVGLGRKEKVDGDGGDVVEGEEDEELEEKLRKKGVKKRKNAKK